MDLELIYKISSILTICAGVIAALAGGVQWWSANIIANRQEAKVAVMERNNRIKKPTIHSIKIISQNIVDGRLFVQKYLVSINSPVQHIPLYTYIKYDTSNGNIERIGKMQLNDVGTGIRQVEGQDISYVDTEYTLLTNRALLEGETIVFTLEKHSNYTISN